VYWSCTFVTDCCRRRECQPHQSFVMLSQRRVEKTSKLRGAKSKK